MSNIMLSRRHLIPRLPMYRPKSTSATRPRLPIPPLHQTLHKYLQSIQPFLLDAYPCPSSYASAYALRVKWADKFERDIGRKLQERLLALDRKSPRNWLDDNFWMKKAYLEWRAPLLINSNWWLAFQNDVSMLNKPKERSASGITKPQICRAAWLIWRTLEFKDKLDRQEHYPDTTRTGLWLRESTASMFNVSRIPLPSCDALSPPPSLCSPNARKVLVMVHNWFYAVEVYRLPSFNIKGAADGRVPVVVIQQRLQAIVRDVEARLASEEMPVPVGVLSADHRDTWAKNLRYLIDLSPVNRKTLDVIHQSLMALSLDHVTNSILPSKDVPYTPELEKQLELDAHVQSIRTPITPETLQTESPSPSSYPALKPAHNRFYDKSFTLIVDPSTRAGATGEHSPCDALVPSIVAEYALVEDVDEDMFVVGRGEDVDEGQLGWERLHWITDTYIKQECSQAEERARSVVENSDDSVLWFEEYGAEWIKDIGKQSPDAYIQLALQLAYYQTRQQFTATYETALTRMFDKGRTETIRTLTTDSRAWVLGMVDSSLSMKEKFTLLQRALQTHTRLTREAATGRGIDRHLMGLRLMLKEGEDAGELFADELFERSMRWKLSTSGLSAGYLFRGTGFGAAYEDGYGINYLAGPELIKFGIECKFSSPYTSTEVFKNAIIGAMREMKRVCGVGMANENGEVVCRL